MPSTFGLVAQAKGAVCSIQPWISALCRHGTWFTQPEICTVCQDACGSYLQNREGRECGEMGRNGGRHTRAGRISSLKEEDHSGHLISMGSLFIVRHERQRLDNHSIELVCLSSVCSYYGYTSAYILYTYFTIFFHTCMFC